jgi:hypothetical protein
MRDVCHDVESKREGLLGRRDVDDEESSLLFLVYHGACHWITTQVSKKDVSKKITNSEDSPIQGGL